MSDTIRLWRRAELEEAAAIEPEGSTMLRVAATPRFLLHLIEYVEAKGGERVEILSAYGDPDRCEVRFYKRDAL